MNIPVYTNVNAEVVASKDDIIPILTKQICCPVRWEDIVRNMAAQGADTFIELGPGKALTGFVKRTLKGVNILNVEPGGYCPMIARLSNGFHTLRDNLVWFFPRKRPTICTLTQN